MNTRSIHFRILLWYALTLLAATGCIFFSFFLVTRQILFNQVDKELFTHADTLVGITNRQGTNLRTSILEQQLYVEFTNMPGMVVLVLDQDGTVIQSSLKNDVAPISYQHLFTTAKHSRDPLYQNQTIGSMPMRFIAYPMRNGADLSGMVLVAHPIDVIQKSLNALLMTLGIICILLILPSILGGYIFASSMMKPITNISNTMDHISSEHLEKRIDNPGTHDEIETFVASFNRLLDRIQESFERERQFIGDVAHELKTPVATLKGEVELALSKKRTANEYQQALSGTLIDTNRLSQTINNILDLAWINAQHTKPQTHHVNLSSALQDAAEIGQKLAAQKHITFTSTIEPNIMVLGSEHTLVRAILNLLDNAVKYTPPDKTVSLSLSKQNDQAVIHVVDTGTGIPKQDLSHVFERFYRGSKTAKTVGSGLGLAIAEGIIKAHHGSIALKSTPGKGTSVRITLPLLT